MKSILAFLNNKTHQIHKQVTKNKEIKSVKLKNINQKWQVDLIHMKRSIQNNQIQFLLTIVDIFSKYTWVFLLVKATVYNVKQKLKQLLDKTMVINKTTFTFKSKIMYTDNRPEFANNTIAKLFENYNIK